jgi:hypothetical protein
MVFVSRNPMWWLVGTAVSLIVAAIIYFAVIKSSNDTVNNAVKTSEKQAQQIIDSATKQAQSATKAAGSTSSGTAASGTAAASGATSAAQTAIDKATKLAACVAKAGTDVSKVQSCQAQYQ